LGLNLSPIELRFRCQERSTWQTTARRPREDKTMWTAILILKLVVILAYLARYAGILGDQS
jgi:hypothetical protein